MSSSTRATRPLSQVVSAASFVLTNLACDLIRCRHLSRLIFPRALMAQYVLLLILFVRPLLGRREGTQSGGAVYRKVVIRNISCTAAVVVSYIITTIITVIALLRQHPDDTTVRVYHMVRYGFSCVFFSGEHSITLKGFA